MTAPACRDCKHWSPLPDKAIPEYGTAVVKLSGRAHNDSFTVPWAPDSGVCGKVNLAKSVADPFDDSLMFVADASDYSACLVTKGSFGCVLFDSAEKSDTARK
jgi:hypothetical protein